MIFKKKVPLLFSNPTETARFWLRPVRPVDLNRLKEKTISSAKVSMQMLF